MSTRTIRKKKESKAQYALPLDYNQEEGERLKAEGIASVRDHYLDWHDAAVEFIQQWIATGREICADDVRKSLPVPPHPCSIGAAFNTVAKRGLIRRVRHQISGFKSTHARLIAVWEPIHR